MENVQNKVVIITGASSGLGAETARHLVKAGAKVIRVPAGWTACMRWPTSWASATTTACRPTWPTSNRCRPWPTGR